MKIIKKLIICLITIFLLVLLVGCVPKTSIETFEDICINTGGDFSPTQNKDFSVCECLGGSGGYSRFAVFYKNVKGIEWGGC